MQPSEVDLVQQAQSGVSRAFGMLIDRYKRAVYGAAYVRLGNFSDAQDIAQEAFLLAYRNLSALQRPEQFGNWLYSIVRNLCNDHLRAQKITQSFDETHPTSQSDPAAEHDRRSLHRRIQRTIAALPRAQRETVTLHYIQGYRIGEIGAFLNVPVGTVKRRLFDARKTLKQEMIDMARSMFDAYQLPDNFQKVIVDSVDKNARTERAKLYVRDLSKRGFTVEIVGHQYFYISHTLAGSPLPRPMTYDFIHKICTSFQIALDHITVTQHRNGHLAELTFIRGNKTLELQASPGYALALAMAFDAPVYADETLLKKMLTKIPEPQPETPVHTWQIGVAPHLAWASFEETEGKPDRVRLALHIQPQPEQTGKMPSWRTRLRRLTTAHLVPVGITHIRIDHRNHNYPLIWLATEKNDRFLPIAIGDYEAGAVAAVLPKSNIDLPNNENIRERGRIYDLLKTLLEAFDITCERVIIDLLHSTIFYALCCLKRGKKQIRLDARPSDAIATALRFDAGILINQTILENEGLNQLR